MGARPASPCSNLLGREEVQELDAGRIEASRDGHEQARVEGLGELRVLPEGGSQGGSIEGDRLELLDGHRGGRGAIGRHQGGPEVDVPRLDRQDREVAALRHVGAEGDAALDHDSENLRLISFPEQLLAGFSRERAAQLGEARLEPRREARGKPRGVEDSNERSLILHGASLAARDAGAAGPVGTGSGATCPGGGTAPSRAIDTWPYPAVTDPQPGPEPRGADPEPWS